MDRRIGILFLVFLGLLGVALARATYLGSVRAGSLERAAATQQVSNVTVPAPRGTITDRNGSELAVSESADDIVADPYLVKHAVSASAALSPTLGIPQLTLIKLLTKPHTGYVPLAHRVPSAEAATVTKLNIAGINLVPEMRRIYPLGGEAQQVVGSVHSDGDGASGIEYRYNGALSGTNGLRRIVSDAIGQPISIDDLRATDPGKTIALTIDSGLQQQVERVLTQVGSEYSPKSATAIAVDPSTGAILALANWRPAGSTSAAGPDDLAIGLNYEPGSTFKAITVAGALQDGLVTPDTEFDIPPVLQFADRQIHDAESHGYEMLSVKNILKFSSNIGADLIGRKLGARRFDYWVRRFGFGAKTGVDLPGEQSGIVLHWWQYSGSSMANLPFGQGESVTPMQMIAAYSAIANGGILRPPHVVQSIGGDPTPVSPGRRIITPNTAWELRDMLRGVFADGGTASGAQIEGYDMAGKTGTANIAINGQYSDSAYVASFIGMVPTDHPRLVVGVVVNQPQGSIFGGSVAAPAFRQIAGWAVPYLGLPPK
jgi:cell division protein FtsI (penicillin-binding protein 3)